MPRVDLGHFAPASVAPPFARSGGASERDDRAARALTVRRSGRPAGRGSGYLQPGSGTLPCTRVPRAGAESTASVPPTAAMRSRMFAIPAPTCVWARVKPRAEVADREVQRATGVGESLPRPARVRRVWLRCQARRGTRNTRRSRPRACNAAHRSLARSPADLIAHRQKPAPRPTRRRSAAPDRCRARGHAARQSRGRRRRRRRLREMHAHLLPDCPRRAGPSGPILTGNPQLQGIREG